MIKQTLLKVLILLFSTNQMYATIPLNKFKSEEFLTDFIETPTRFIVSSISQGWTCKKQ